MHSQSYRHNWSIVHIYSMNLKGRRIHSLHFYLFNLNSSKKGGVLWHFQCLVFENMCRCQYSTYLKKIHFCSAKIYQDYNSEETKIITYSSKRYSFKSFFDFFWHTLIWTYYTDCIQTAIYFVWDMIFSSNFDKNVNKKWNFNSRDKFWLT